MKASGGIMNTTVNKSGQNLNNNFAKGGKTGKGPQTHRNGLG